MEKKKKYIIIALVALVAVWLLWKKGVFDRLKASVANSGSDDGGNASSGIDLDYILSHITFSGVEREKINKCAKAWITGTTQYQDVQAKAYENYLTFDQQLVCDAMWLLCKKEGKITSERYQELCQKVKKL